MVSIKSMSGSMAPELRTLPEDFIVHQRVAITSLPGPRSVNLSLLLILPYTLRSSYGRLCLVQPRGTTTKLHIYQSSGRGLA